MKGWVLNYLENDKSEDLITKHADEQLTITGKIYPAERILEVESYKAAAEDSKK